MCNLHNVQIHVYVIIRVSEQLLMRIYMYIHKINLFHFYIAYATRHPSYLTCVESLVSW